MTKSNWNYPTTMWVGENRIKDLDLACKILEIKKPLLVTDKGLANSKIVLNAIELLEKKNIKVDIFSDVVGNETVNNVKEGDKNFKKKK